jgi:hypothetical protein
MRRFGSGSVSAADLGVAVLLDARLFAAHGARDLLGVRHLALTDADLFVNDRLLLEVDSLLV